MKPTRQDRDRLETALRAVRAAFPDEDDAELALEQLNHLFVAGGLEMEDTAIRVAETLGFLSDAVLAQDPPPSAAGLSWILGALQSTVETAIAYQRVKREGTTVVALRGGER